MGETYRQLEVGMRLG